MPLDGVSHLLRSTTDLILWLCALAWRLARTVSRRLDNRGLGIVDADRPPPRDPLFFGERCDCGNRFRHDGGLCCARPASGSILADHHGGTTTRDDTRSPNQVAGFRANPTNIHHPHRISGLASSACADGGNDPAYAQVCDGWATVRDYLKIISPASAGAWSDVLERRFGSIGRMLAATSAARAQSVPASATSALDLLAATILATLRAEAMVSPSIHDGAALRRYLYASAAHQPVEILRSIFLDSAQRIISDEVVTTGSLSEVPIYSRVILTRALELSAAGVILVHNHPSGNPVPSRSDIAATSRLSSAARELEIVVYDHLIVADGGVVSMRDLGLL